MSFSLRKPSAKQRRISAGLIIAAFAVAGIAAITFGHAATANSADLNNDGKVDLSDLSILLSDYGKPGATIGDINGDSAVNLTDLSILLSKFGSTSTGTGGIVFEDDFNGPANQFPDRTKWGQWSTCSYNSSAAYGNIQCGEDETLDGQGHLIIPATPTRGQSLTTGDRFKFVYGTLSAWIKFPPQPGYWPAFWTLNNNADGTNQPYLGELDVMEGYTTWEDGVIAGSGYHAGFHNWANTGTIPHTGGGPDLCPQPGINLSAGFHKYSAKIEPNKLTFYFDDKQCGGSYGPESNPNKPYGFGPSVMNGNWLILALAVGGAGGQQIPATQPAQMLVDRVEVRSL